MTRDRISAGVAGLSLVELMIAIALGAVLLLAVTEVVVRNSAVRGELEHASIKIENGIYALALFETELTNAGYWGEVGAQSASAIPPALLAGSEPNVADALDALWDTLGYPVQGGEAPPDPGGFSVKNGTDYIVVRRVSSCSLGATGCELAAAGDVYLQVNSCLEWGAVPSILMSNSVDDLDAETRACDGTLAPRNRFISRLFYVDDSDQLVSAELSGTGAGSYVPEILVEGVETLQLDYGLDSVGGDGQIDEYRDPVDDEWANVVAVRVTLVIRSPESSAGYTDTRTYAIDNYTVPAAFSDYKRQVFSRTITLPNVAGRRE